MQITLVKIVDRNDFNAVLACRAFTSRAAGLEWGEREANRLSEAVKAKDENELADIEMEHDFMIVDDFTELKVRPSRGDGNGISVR